MVQKSKYLSLTAQIEIELRNRILQGVYPIKSLLPTQEQLSLEFSVSRITIRQVFDNLRKKNMIRSYKGKGTIVLETFISEDPHSTGGFSDFTREINQSLYTDVLLINTNSLYSIAQENLGISYDSPCIHIQRIRSVDQIKAELENSYLNHSFFPNIDWNQKITANISLYNFLKQEFNISIIQVEEYISAILPDKKIQHNMDLDALSPLLSIKRKTFAKEFTSPFEYCENYLLSEYLGKLTYNI